MAIEMTKYDEFDRFLTGEMSPDEEEQFRQQLSEDQDLSAQFEEHKAFCNTLQQWEREQFRNRLLQKGSAILEQEKAAHSAPGKVRQINTRKSFYRIAAAASIILLLIPASLYYYNNVYHPSQLFSEYYSPYENVVAPTMRGEEAQSAKLQESLDRYTAREFEEAVTELSAFIEQHPGQAGELRLYLGISHLETGSPEKATEQFQMVIQENGRFAHQARWYLAMTHLNNGQTEQARKQLQTLAEAPGSSYKEKAQEVLAKL